MEWDQQGRADFSLNVLDIKGPDRILLLRYFVCGSNNTY